MGEIKSIYSGSARTKTTSQLKGGSKDCEFYCTYSTFESLCVHSKEHLTDKTIEEDHPINMREEELLRDKQKLPQMRFLMNDQYILEMTIQLIFEGIRLGTQGSSEKEKMRSTLQHVLSQFMSVEHLGKIKARSFQLNFINEEVQDAICNKDYYELKEKDLFHFHKYSEQSSNKDDEDV